MRLSARPTDRGFGPYMALRTKGSKIRVFLDGDQLRLDEVVTVDADAQQVELFQRTPDGERINSGKQWLTHVVKGKVIVRITP